MYAHYLVCNEVVVTVRLRCSAVRSVIYCSGTDMVGCQAESRVIEFPALRSSRVPGSRLPCSQIVNHHHKFGRLHCVVCLHHCALVCRGVYQIVVFTGLHKLDSYGISFLD